MKFIFPLCSLILMFMQGCINKEVTAKPFTEYEKGWIPYTLNDTLTFISEYDTICFYVSEKEESIQTRKVDKGFQNIIIDYSKIKVKLNLINTSSVFDQQLGCLFRNREIDRGELDGYIDGLFGQYGNLFFFEDSEVDQSNSSIRFYVVPTRYSEIIDTVWVQNGIGITEISTRQGENYKLQL